MFKITTSLDADSFSPMLTITGKISLENIQDLMNIHGEESAKSIICEELFEAIDKRSMNLEDIDVEKEWSEYKKSLLNPPCNLKLFDLFIKMGLITIETDMGGSYVRLTKKGEETD